MEQKDDRWLNFSDARPLPGVNQVISKFKVQYFHSGIGRSADVPCWPKWLRAQSPSPSQGLRDFMMLKTCFPYYTGSSLQSLQTLKMKNLQYLVEICFYRKVSGGFGLVRTQHTRIMSRLSSRSCLPHPWHCTRREPLSIPLAVQSCQKIKTSTACCHRTARAAGFFYLGNTRKS